MMPPSSATMDSTSPAVTLDPRVNASNDVDHPDDRRTFNASSNWPAELVKAAWSRSVRSPSRKVLRRSSNSSMAATEIVLDDDDHQHLEALFAPDNIAGERYPPELMRSIDWD